MALQHEVDRRPRRGQPRIVERALAIDRREARREQKRVALAQRYAERLRQQQHHVAARLRAAAFDETQMLLGDLGVEREIELGEPAQLPPVADQGADGGVECVCS